MPAPTTFTAQRQGAALKPALTGYGNVAVAYSLRKVVPEYFGPAVKVRRSSDNAEADIPFCYDPVSREQVICSRTILSFVGSNSAYVTTWYDQTTNARNATQTTAANQPRIVNAGVVETLNGKPIIAFDGVNDVLQNSQIAAYLTNKNYTLTAALQTATIRAGAFSSHYISLSGTGTAIRGYLYTTGPDILSFAYGNTNPTLATPVTDGTPVVVSAQRETSTLANSWLNGGFLGAYAISYSGSFTDLSVGAFAGGSNGSNVKVGEIVFVDGTVTDATRQKLERNQGHFYGITVA